MRKRIRINDRFDLNRKLQYAEGKGKKKTKLTVIFMSDTTNEVDSKRAYGVENSKKYNCYHFHIEHVWMIRIQL